MTRPILIVDEEAAVTLALESFFESKGYPVVRAFYGDQAITQIEKNQPSVVVLDLQMPGVDGITVREKIRQSHPTVKTLVITGHSDKYQKDLDRLKPDAVMLKPVSLEDLTREIDALLGASLQPRADAQGKQRVRNSLRLLFVGWPIETYAQSLKPYFEGTDHPGRATSYETVVAPKPEDSFRLVKEFKPHLVLLENNRLPVGMDPGRLAADLSRLEDPFLEVILHSSQESSAKGAAPSLGELKSLEETIQRAAERRGWVSSKKAP